MSKSEVRPVQLVGALVVAIVAISSAALLIRMSASKPLVIAFYRLLYATVLLAPFALNRAKIERVSLGLRDWFALVGTGVVLAIHFATWITSLAPASRYATSVAASAVLVTMHPVMVALLAPIALHERVPRRATAGILVAILGAVVIAWMDAQGGKHRLIGDVLALIAALAAAIYFISGRRLRARLSVLVYATPVYASAALTLAVLAVANGDSLAITSIREHAIFLGLAIGPMILGHTILNWALGHCPAWLVSTAVLAEPIASTAMVFVVLGDRPPVGAVLGGAIALVGVSLASIRRGA